MQWFLGLFLMFAACSTPEEPAVEAVAEVEAPAPVPAAAEPEAAPEPELAVEAAPIPSELLDPSAATETAPDTFRVKFETTKGDIVLTAHRDWSPKGADRFYNLVRVGFFRDIAFFRVIDGFMVQFGIHGDPRVSRAWKTASVQDDPVTQSNRRGFVSFATSGPNTRTTQMFINLVDNGRLDGMGFSPFAEVTSGMDVVDALYSGYGEGAPSGRGPFQGRLQDQGNAYLKADFGEMDYLKSAEIIE